MSIFTRLKRINTLTRFSERGWFIYLHNFLLVTLLKASLVMIDLGLMMDNTNGIDIIAASFPNTVEQLGLLRNDLNNLELRTDQGHTFMGGGLGYITM